MTLDATLRDVRYAIRSLAKHPVFTAAAVVTLALAIGANTAILSVVDAVLLKPLSYRDPGTLVAILNHDRDPVAPSTFAAWQKRATAFSRMGAAEYWTVNYTHGDGTDRIPALRLTADVLPTLGVAPLLGRVWSADADQAGHDHVVVLSYALWNRLFARDRAVIGRQLSFNGDSYTVIGVMPPGFAFAPFWATHAELWAPLALGNRVFEDGGQSLRVFARLAPGATLARARGDIASISADLNRQSPGATHGTEVNSLTDLVVGAVRTPLYVLMGAVLFVLFIACANVAHMLLARGAGRQREIAVRAALGASRRRTVRQLLTESLILALAGGAGGVAIAFGGVRLLAALGASSIPRVQGAAIDARILVVAIVASAGTALAFGLVPALRATAVDLSESLKDGSRGATDGGRRSGFRRFLIASEFALALVLLDGAGLMVRTFAALSAHDPGFNPHGVWSAVVSVQGTAEEPANVRTAFYEQVLQRLRATPGVASVSAINHLPIGGDLWGFSFHVAGLADPAPRQPRSAVYRVVFPGYFDTMRLPILRGRDFTDADRADAPGVVIVNRKLAEHVWPGENPLGKRITLGDPDRNPQWLTVVGVSKDAAEDGVSDAVGWEMYLPYLQQAQYQTSPDGHFAYMTFVVRAACASAGARCDAATTVPALRHIVGEVDRRVAISQIQTMDAVMADATADRRFYLVLMVTFAVVALALAAVGIYGVTSYSVSQRTHEIGLRIALGARPAQMLAHVVGEGMRVALIGAVVGAAGAFALARLLSGILYGVSAHDPATFATVIALLAAVAAVASYLPARRATRVAPLTALRGR